MAAGLEELMQQWSALGRGSDRTDTEGAILKSARPIAVRVARSRGMSEADADDIAQETCSRLLRSLADRGAPTGSAEAYLWRIAENATTDAQRSRGRHRAKTDAFQRHIDTTGRHSEDAEAQWLKREERALLVEHLKAGLEAAPENYRNAIQRRLDGETAEEIAADYYREMVAAGEVDESDGVSASSARRKARNRADQHMKRGIAWLQKWLVEKMSEDGP